MNTTTQSHLRATFAVALLCVTVMHCLVPVRSNAQENNTSTNSLPKFAAPTGPRLRELAANDGSVPILIGGSSNSTYLGTVAETILHREFAFVTPGNAFKQSAIHPEPNVWNWKKADDWVDRCAANGQIMRLHACISPQCSAWAEDDSRTGEELLQNLNEYVRRICKRYNGRAHIRWLDVVNETVTREGDWFGPREGTGKWENPWTKIGFDESHPLRPPLYIKRAFELANEHAPDIKLLINQHGGMEEAAWQKIRKTVLYLRKKGLRVDGIGWQGHIDVGFEQDDTNMRRLNSLITWAHSHDLEFHVTENTVWLTKGRENDYAAQAATFAAIVRVLLKHADDGVVTWNAWQIRDQDTKRQGMKGCLFDDNGSPKPAYYAVQKELAMFARNLQRRRPK